MKGRQDARLDWERDYPKVQAAAKRRVWRNDPDAEEVGSLVVEKLMRFPPKGASVDAAIMRATFHAGAEYRRRKKSRPEISLEQFKDDDGSGWEPASNNRPIDAMIRQET